MLHKISRRKFTHGLMAAGGMLLISRRARAAEFELRQFHNQPADSPLDKWLVQMWDAVKTETNGRVQVQTFPDNNKLAGGDPAALNMVVSGELDFFTLNGGSIGNLVPASNVQGVLFAFRTPAQVFDSLDGDLGDYLREEMKTNMEELIHHFIVVTEGLKAPPGEVYFAAENPKGELGFYINSKGGGVPHRLKIRAPSFVNLSILPELLPGCMVSDVPAVLGSLDFVMGECDR